MHKIYNDNNKNGNWGDVSVDKMIAATTRLFEFISPIPPHTRKPGESVHVSDTHTGEVETGRISKS